MILKVHDTTDIPCMVLKTISPKLYVLLLLSCANVYSTTDTVSQNVYVLFSVFMLW